MAFAAVPDYLRRLDLSQATPGLRFGMYLQLWGEDRHTGAMTWETRDTEYKVTGQERQERQVAHENKREALQQATKLHGTDKATMKAIAQRQSALAAPLEDAGQLLRVEALSVAPFTTGLGNAHPLENGFAFLNPYGLPYLPGSGLKGVLRRAARELASGDWGDTNGWDDAAVLALFGHGNGDDEASDGQRGALIFWDALPRIAADTLHVEVMTPHQSHYYQQHADAKSGDSTTPHDSGQPNPIHFLTVPPGSSFTFLVQCDIGMLRHHAPALESGHRWQAMVRAALEHAFAWLGFGAKTAVGYGAMEPDARAERAAKDAREHLRKQAEVRAEAEAREAAKQSMSPAERAMADLYDQRVDKNQTERSVLFAALKAGKLAEHRAQAAARVRALMEQSKEWREKSTKKNPDKDHDYQATLLVMGWLKQ